MSQLCPICQENTGDFLTTPCGHKFHKDCLKGLTRPKCPLCKGNLNQFLVKSCGLSSHEIRQRINEDEDRIVHESFQNQDIEYLTDDMCIFMLHQEMRHNWNNWMAVFMDVIIDRIIDARRYFASISSHRGGCGLFRYFYCPKDVEELLLNSYTKSKCRWWKPSRRDRNMLDPQLIHTSDEVLGKVKNSVQTDFGVLIIIENPSRRQYATSCILTTNVTPPDDAIACRIAHRDVQFSLTRSLSCRHSGHSPYDSNPEYIWARNVWKRTLKNNRYPTITVSAPTFSDGHQQVHSVGPQDGCS
jgi:hypothetical protein